MKLNYKYFYLSLIVIFGIWGALFPFFKEEFLSKFYFMPFLGIIAATVANITPAAAGIVYFPVLTRIHMDPVTVVQFSLVIQAYGMGLGSLRWFCLNRNLFITNVIPVSLIGGAVGMVLGNIFIPIYNPEFLTLVFNSIAFIFTQVIFFSILFKRTYPNRAVSLTPKNCIIFFMASLIGGLISGWIGFGIDTIFYFLLTMVYRINPAASIVTSISIMAATSVMGTLLNLLFHDVPFSLWYSAVPGVSIAGLFLAAYFAIKIGPRNVLLLFTVFLSIDFFMTLWTQSIIPLPQNLRSGIIGALVVYLAIIHFKIFKQGYKTITPDHGAFVPDAPLPKN